MNDVRCLERWGLKWRLNPSYEELLMTGLDGLEPPWSNAFGVQILKDTTARGVFSAELNSGISKEKVLIKTYRCPGVLNSLKYLIKSSKAKNEWEMMNRLIQLGIPTARPLAYGERRNWWGRLEESCLITREIDGCRSLDLFVKAMLRDGAGLHVLSNFTRQLAQFVKLIHDKGVNHRDFHAGNFLVQEDGGGNFNFFLIDLHRATIERPLGARLRIRALSDLNNFFSGFISRPARFRFLKFYAQADDAISESLSLFARRIERKSQKEVRRRHLGRLQRCFGSNDEFESFSSGALKAFFRREYHGPALQELLLDPERFVAAAGASVMKDSKKVKVLAAEAEFGGERKKLFIKRFGREGVFYPVKNLFRRSRAFKAWAAAHALNLRRPLTPKAVAAIELRSWGFLRRSYLITEEAEGATSLDRFFRANFSPPLSKERIRHKRHFIRQFARFIKYIHNQAIFHDDLKGGNILVCGERAGPYKFFLIDIDRVSLKKGRCERRRIRDLVKINFTFRGSGSPTLADRMRFLSEYLAGSSWLANGRDRFWRTVERKTAEKLARSTTHAAN